MDANAQCAESPRGAGVGTPVWCAGAKTPSNDAAWSGVRAGHPNAVLFVSFWYLARAGEKYKGNGKPSSERGERANLAVALKRRCLDSARRRFVPSVTREEVQRPGSHWMRPAFSFYVPYRDTMRVVFCVNQTQKKLDFLSEDTHLNVFMYIMETPRHLRVSQGNPGFGRERPFRLPPPHPNRERQTERERERERTSTTPNQPSE